MNRMYVAYWNTNGTNDLIITDEDSQIIAVISDALFGVYVDTDDRMDDQIVAIEDAVIMATREDIEEFNLQLVNQITIEDVLQYLACSPIDPKGERILEQLNNLGLVA